MNNYDPSADGWDWINRILMKFGLHDDSAQAICIGLCLIGMYAFAILRMSLLDQ